MKYRKRVIVNTLKILGVIGATCAIAALGVYATIISEALSIAFFALCGLTIVVVFAIAMTNNEGEINELP